MVLGVPSRFADTTMLTCGRKSVIIAAYANKDPQTAAEWSSKLTTWGTTDFCIPSTLQCINIFFPQALAIRIQTSCTLSERAPTPRAVPSAARSRRTPMATSRFKLSPITSLSALQPVAQTSLPRPMTRVVAPRSRAPTCLTRALSSS